MRSKVVNDKIVSFLLKLMLPLILFCMFPTLTKAVITTVGTSEDISYTGGIRKWDAPYTGYYQLEVWGAQGGELSGYYGGGGGYATGVVLLKKGEPIFIVVGGKGTGATAASQTLKGGYNGGGGVTGVGGINHMTGSGGGATHIAKSSGVLSSLANNKSSVLIVAGGGGGARNQPNHVSAARWGAGGSGGGYIGGGAISNISSNPVTDVSGTQTSGYAFGQGGSGKGNSGGGGGWYGGYSGDSTGKSYTGSGGAGSGYIANPELISYKGITKVMYGYKVPTSNNENTYTVSTTNYSKDPESYYAKTGDGYARITLIEMLNNDARIDTVNISGTNFDTTFDKDTYTYNLLLDSENSTVTIDATAVNSATTISGTGEFDIPAGTSTIKLIGTAESGTTATYTINVTRPNSSYKYLKDIQIDGQSIQGFNPTTLTYNITVPYSTNDLNLNIIKGRPSQSVYEPIDLKVPTGTKKFEIVVVSEDGQYTTTYTLNITKPHSSKLSSLDFGVFKLEPAFDPETLTYKLSLLPTTLSLKPTYTTFDEEAKVKLEGFGYIKTSGTAKITVTEPNCSPTVYTIELDKYGMSAVIQTEFPYTGNEQTFTAPIDGFYQLEVWGAQGGGANGGYGAYSTGIIKLSANETIFINVGGQGARYAGGYNGGGKGAAGKNQWSYGGGGATHIATSSGLLSSFENDKDSILIVAGGGGGNGGSTPTAPGGSGGGYMGSNGYDTVNRSYNAYTGTGASQTKGGYTANAGSSSGKGTFGQGGNYHSEGYGGAGGGGGFYGGGGSNRGHGGGGGGSGYIGNEKLFTYKEVTKEMYGYNVKTSNDPSTYTVSTTNVSNSPISQYAKGGSGYARITLLPGPNENNFLSSLTVKATNYETKQTTVKNYTPSFDLEEEDYYVTVDALETEITLIARPEDSTANIKGLGTFEVPAGTTTFSITVTSEAGTEKIYNVHVTRPASSNQYPIDIIISGLVPSLCVGNNSEFCKVDTFNENVHEYELVVPYRIKQLQFDVHKGHPFQTVSGEGKISLDSGLNEIIIDVTSEDGANTQRYIYHVTRDMTGDTDIEFKILDPEYELNFDPDISEYYITVDNSYSKYMYVNGNDPDNIGKEPRALKDETLAELKETIQMYIKTDDENANFVVSGPSTLATGMNEINIIVSSSSGDIKTYVIHLYRQKNENAFLSNLEVINVADNTIKYPSTPKFNKLNLGPYQVVVENNIEEVNIVANPEVKTSTVTGTGKVKLNTGSNKQYIKVTAENGTIETYTIDIIRKKNSNTNLSDIRVFDEENTYSLDPTFAENTLLYNVNVPEGTSRVTIEATSEVATTTYKLLDNDVIKVGLNVKRVMAIAEDGSNKIYTINITRPANSNNYLKDLIVKKGETEFTLDPTFNKEEEDYTLTVENEINYVDIIATLDNPLAKLDGARRYNLAVGENKIKVTVTSEDNKSREYNITITRKPNNNAYLESIQTSAGTLVPEFDKKTDTYKINVENAIKEITITGLPEVVTTTVTGNDKYKLETGNSNIITLTTLAEDKVSTKTYTIEIIRDKSSNTNIKKLWMEEGGLNPVFNSQITDYTARVPYEVTTATFHVELEDEKATYEILGNWDNLDVGENEIIVRVKSEKDPDIYKDYTIVVTRQEEGTTSSYLDSLTVSSGTLTPEFKKEKTYYEVYVPYDVEKVKISATTEDVLAKLSGTGEKILEVGNNIFTIKVEATDGTTREYQVMINRDLSNEARLSSLILDGSALTPMFNKDVYEYRTTTENSYLEFIQITTIEESAFFSIDGNYFTEKGEHIVTIEVTAPDMKTTKTYTIIVTKGENNNNNLAWLEIEGYEITPLFSNATTLYSLTVPNNINDVNIIAFPENEFATVDGTGIREINVGVNQLTVKVTSESGKEKVYTILVTKEGNDNNNLDYLEVLNGTMTPSFDGRLEYDVEVDYNETALDLNVKLSDPNASYTINNNDLKVGLNKVIVAVSAENGQIKNYILNVTRKEIVSALLEDINIKNYKLEQEFNSYVTSYNVIVNNETTSLDLTPIPLDKKATYKIIGNENFVVGDNTITIEVTASDNVTKETYTLNVKRQPLTNTFLDYLYTDKGDLTPIFKKDIMEYSITVPYETDKIELIGEAQDKSTTVTGLGEHLITTGENIIPVTVTATNGVKRIYYVTVNRNKNDDNFLASLIAKVGGITYDLNPEFSQTETKYNVEVPVGTSSINLIGTLSSDTAKVEGLGIHTLHAGENTITITVTSESGIEKEYKVIVNRPANDNNHLMELTPSAGILEPDFSYEETNYTINLDSSVGVLSFNAVPEDRNATVTGGESQVVPDGTSIRKIIVKAENGSEREYTITINKERTDNALLDDLYVIGYPFDGGVTFNENVTEYHITVPNNKQVLLASEVVAVSKDKNATITKSGNVTLSTNTEIEYAVSVIAPDGFTKKTYKIKIAREKSSNALLSMLKVNVGYMKEVFNPTTFEYTWVVPKRTTLTPESVLAIAQDPGAKIEKTVSIFVTSDTTEKYIVKVISEDGNSQEYVLKIEADVSSDKTLKDLIIDKGYYTPKVSETVTTFDVYEYVDTDKINVEAIPNSEDSRVTSGNGEVILTEDETEHTITVTAEDGTTETYVLKIHRTIKKEEGLKNLGLNNLDPDYCDKDKCTLTPKFITDTLNYKIKVPYEYENLDILAEKMNEQQTVKYKIGDTYITNYKLPMGTTTVNVEVYDGMNKLTRNYTLEVERCKSSNNYLKSLKVGVRNNENGNLDLYELEPEFNKKIQEYTINVENDIDEVEIYGIPEIEGNIVSINGYNYLQEGSNDATITVVAPDGSQRTYIIHIIKNAEYNSLIKNIYVSTGLFWDLSPKFNPTTFDYVTTIKGPYEKAKIDAVPVVPSTIITGIGEMELKTGNNIVTLIATSAEDGSVSTYRINVIKEPSINVDLESLIVEEGTLNPDFNSGITKYNISVGETVNKLTIHAIPKDRTSTVKITGNENLISGDNYINIIVTNKDKTASKIYQLLVHKDKSSNSSLRNIRVYDQEVEFSLKPVFNKNVFEYKVTVPYTQEKVTIDAVAESLYAPVVGTGEYYLNYGHNVQEIKVTSEAGTISTYKVDIYREYDLYLKNLTTDIGILNPEFSKEKLFYTIDVPYTNNIINLRAEPNSNKVTVGGTGEYTLQTGENTFKITTIDPDNNKRVHTVIVNRAKNDNNYIKELSVKGYLNPIFEKTTQEYTVDVRKDVTELNLEVELEAKDATYEILNNSGFTATNNPNKVTIRVTAENGDTRDYVLNVNLQPDEFFSNRLISLTVNQGKLVPDFNPDVNNYTVIVANSIDSITIETIKENPYSKVTYNGKIDNKIPLAIGRNVIEVAVTSPEGYKNSYYVIAYRDESSDATLASLKVKGFNLLPIFARYTFNYSLDVGSETTSLDIEAIPYDPKSTVQITGQKNIATGENDVKILVIAPDGVTTKEYSIKVTKGASRNNYLSDLNVSNYTFDKQYNKLDQGPYVVNVDNDVNSIMINATPEVNTTTVAGDGAISLNSGQNILSIVATSEFGDIRTYTIIVNRSKSSDSSLKDILLSDETLDPAFDSDTLEYTVTVPKELESITITGIPNVLTSSVSGNDTYKIEEDEFTIPLVVTAEDGSKTTYKVKIVKDISYSSKLKSLIVKDGELYPGFHKLITMYTILVPNEVTELNLEYVPEDSEAQIVINGNQNFKVGTNTVTIDVTARDGGDTTTYTISVVRQPIASNYLLDLAVEGYTMNPKFDKTILYYQVDVPIDTEVINIIGTLEDATSTISGTGLKSVNKGINRFYVKVESASGIIRTYQIEVNRKESEENKLLSLISDIGTLNPSFDTDTNSYRLSVPEGTTEINLTGTSSERSTVVGLGKVIVPLEGINHNIIVTSESGTTNTYTIEIIRTASDNTELENLIPSAGTLEYSNDILEYTLEVPDTQNVISFTATPKNPAATVTGLDLTNLDYGDNDLEIVVTAEDGVTKRTIKIKVKRMKDLISIIPSETNIVITKEEEKEITYTLNPTDTSYPDVEWISNDSTIATVDDNGKITGVEYGSTIVQIVSKHDNTIYATINVNVMNLRITSQVYDVVRIDEVTIDPDVLAEYPDPEDYVIGAEPEMTLNDFLAQFDNNPHTLHVYDNEGNEIVDEPDTYIGTGMTMKLILEDKTYDEIKIVVRGDLDGDGLVLMADYARMKNTLLSIIQMDYLLSRAADVDSDGFVLMADYATLKNYLLNIITSLN